MSETSTSRKAALWVGVVFLLGAALGGMLGYIFAHRSYAAPPAQVSDQLRRQQKVELLTRELKLTPAQAQQFDGIIAEIQAQFKAIRKQAEPQLDEARQKGRERLRAVLTPEQRPKFEEYLQRLDEERKRNAQQ